MIVKERGRALIYALGDGEGTNGDWTLKRRLYNTIDDVHSWGEVLRVDGTKFSESDLFTVDGTAHTVTVKQAYSTFSTVTQLALTALNIQLNTGAGVGALQFTSGNANLSSTLLAGTLTLGNDLSFAGTGLNSLTRDNGGNDPFSGTFEGSDKTITLATGEIYGLNAEGNALTSNSKQGNIYRHTHNGLFAETKNATVQNLTIDGNITIYQSETGLRAGFLTAFAEGSLTLSSVTIDGTLSYKTSSNYTFSFGTAIGNANGTGLSVSADSCDFTATVTDTTDSNINFATVPVYSLIGGFLGSLTIGSADSPTQSVSVANSSINLTYSKTTNTNLSSIFGGVIAEIGNSTYVKSAKEGNALTAGRAVTIDTVSLTLTATGTANNERFGGILGGDWLSCDVTIDGLTIDASVTANGNATATPFGGLTQTATGAWNLLSLTLSSATFALPSNSSTFGFIANKSYTNRTVDLTTTTKIQPESALYLEVTDASYAIGALTFSGNPTFACFDELVLSGIGTGSDVTQNGNSVISVTTSGNAIDTTGSDYNTYLNKTAYGRTANGAVNPNVRYYYNVAYARSHTATSKYDFLVWSIKTYAHSSLADWFTPTGSTFSGSLDMTGLSYYPVDLESNITFSSATIKLDNVLTESSVHFAYRYTSGTLQTSTARTTLSSTNQHYLMHAAVFRNVATSNVTLTTVTIQGNVPLLSSSFCGFLIAGTLGGSDAGKAKATLTSITLNGVYVSTASSHLTSNGYAPLMINKIGKNTTLDWNGATQSDYSTYSASGYYAGSSLIGDVGDAAARAIYMTFSHMALDARISATSIDNFDTVYSSLKSVFSRATFLNSFLYFSESSAGYTFEATEDRTSAVSATHTVTYGKEITTSVEKADKQKKYYGSEYYVHPTAFQSASSYDFSNGFLPYVYVAYNLGEKKHEIAVNVTFASEIEGCGKYGDPFIIDDDEKLPILSKILSGGDVGNTVQLYLPSDLTSFDNTGTTYTKYLYNFDTATLTSSNGGASQTNANVRRYLAGAYFVITRDITLPSDYIALGTAADAQYAFRGVIVGRGNPVVTNTSPNPLVQSSNGCVLKDFTLDVDVDYDSANTIELASPLGGDTFAYSNGIQSYGALIRQIMGGDTFIDAVDVTFTSVSFSITAKTVSNYPRLTPVGGYVGALVNGGLIFRNMSSTNVGLTAAEFNKIADAGYLYVNPIIGRVLAGYAFHETSAYRPTESACTLKNGEKNYTIADLSLSAGKLNVTYANSKFTVTVPDGQAMFILGAIVNSGAASAAYDASTAQPYEDFTDTFWSAYRAHTTARAGAAYTAVGVSGFASDADFTDYASLDSYTATLVKIPYVIRAYSNKTGSVYHARSLTSSDSTIVSITGNCDVAQGFRGIGSMYYDSNYLRLRISSLSGAWDDPTESDPYAYTVTLHIRYLEYAYKYATAYHAVTNTAGLGLFNTTFLKTPASSGITNLILAGSIYYNVYTVSGSAITCLLNSSDENGADYDQLLSVGGVIGYITKPFYFKNVTFNGLSVEGVKNVGGLVGYTFQQATDCTSVSQILYDATASNTKPVVSPGVVNATGGLTAGGLVGRLYRASIAITSSVTSGYTDIKIGNIYMKSGTPDDAGKAYPDNQITGAGGLIGNGWARHNDNNYVLKDTIHGDQTSNNLRPISITNINVTKGTNNALVKVLNDTGATQRNYAGGFFGVVHNCLLTISHCKLTNVNVKANVVGGVFGKATQKYSIHIVDVEVDGANAATLDGARYAGGIAGWLFGHDEFYIEVASTVVKNYTIVSSTTNSQAAAAGGVFGCAEGENKNVSDSNNHVCEINNVTVDNVQIQTNYTDSNPAAAGNTTAGTGGFIGLLTGKNSNTKFKFSGYNLLIKDSTLTYLAGGLTNKSTSATNRKIGDIIGNNNISSTVKFVGVSVQNASYCGKHAGYYNSANENYGSDGTFGSGYIVFADFAGTNTNTAFSTVQDGTSNADDYVNVAVASPYMTANPSVTIGGVLLTGDGVGTAVDSLPIQSILTDNAKYKYAIDNYYTGSSGNKNGATWNSYASKLTMFTSKVTSGYIGTNFPILIADDSDKANTTKMINSYLRLLTNTRYSFQADTAGVYEVVIYRMTYENGVFTPYLSNVSLKKDANGFFTTNAAVDSGSVQFSLIDVRFFDPAKGPNESLKVAYHLYVPVFVERILDYSFDIAVQTGTTYLESSYTSRYGQALIENLGSPVTLYFRYTYSRSAQEWADAINAGENVHRNYAKQLYFYKANTNDSLKDFPTSTILVLVDKNRGGKVYYATIGTALSGNTLNLSAFKETMTKTADVLTFGGNAFAPLTFDTMLGVTVSTVGGGTDTLVACDAQYATLMIGNQGYRLATDEELADNSVTKYTASVAQSILERYYLSIFTESTPANDLLFHYFLITTPSTFNDTLPPAKIADTGSHTMVHLTMGKIFHHSDLHVSSRSSDGSQIMTTDNDDLIVTLMTEIGLSDDLDSGIKEDVRSMIVASNVYQSFIIYLNRKEGATTAKAVIGSPTVTGSYTVDYVLNTLADSNDATSYAVANVRVKTTSIEVVTSSLNLSFQSHDKFEVHASVTITYAADKIKAQFPGRGVNFETNGVTISADSNVAFSTEGTTYSKNSINEVETPAVSYYSEAEPLSAKLDLSALGDGGGSYTPLGINALNLESETPNIADFDLGAFINATSVEDQITTYTKATVKITLMQKNADGEYVTPLTIGNYLTVTMEGEAANAVQNNGTDFTFVILTTNPNFFRANPSEITLPTIHVHVKTGSLLESAGGAYSNYKIWVEVVLSNGADPIEASRVSNYVIYTNAKILPYYIS